MMDEGAMDAYYHLLKSVSQYSNVDDKIKIYAAYTLFKVVTEKELTKKEKRIVENWWKNWRINSNYEVQ
jgi:hypothetical protein